MNSAAFPHQDTSLAPISRQAVFAVIIGNWLEFFDFIVYSYFAVMIGRTFFPSFSPIGSLLASVATFGAGFITRPIGAAIIGAYADRAGRKPAMALTLVLMAGGTGLLGLTPSYAAIGVAAPCLVVLARLVQGFAVGGEVGPATTYLLESASVERRARATSWQATSQVIAAIMGSGLGFILSSTLSANALYDWGWRVPFIAGMLIAPLGVYIRAHLPDTIAVTGESKTNGSAILADLFGSHSPAILWGILIVSGGTIATYISGYFTTYAITTLHLSPKIGMLASLVGDVGLLSGLPLGAWAVDRFARKPVLIISRVAFLLAVYPCFYAFTQFSAQTGMLLALRFLLGFVFGFSNAGIYAVMAEAFPQAVRSSGLSILYSVGVMVFGGTTQLVVTWLIARSGSPMVPAWYLIASQFLTILGVALIKRARDDQRLIPLAEAQATG